MNNSTKNNSFCRFSKKSITFQGKSITLRLRQKNNRFYHVTRKKITFGRKFTYCYIYIIAVQERKAFFKIISNYL